MLIVTETIDERLLNIKQAARMLNVSVVSLRRWTNSGKLACLRVGPKRERRFRRADLEAFLETSSPTTRARSKPATGTQIDVEGIAIEPGSHLCAFYENDLGRVKLAVPFLADGLEGGDICCLVAAPDAIKDILHHLGAVCTHVEEFIAAGRFLVSEGMPTWRAMYEHEEHILVEATRAGKRSVRMLGDMAWAMHQRMGIDELMEFEMRYNQSLAGRFPVASLCQYDARKFSGTAVLAALKCHDGNFRYPLVRFLN